MHIFDYSFLDNGLLPTSIVNLTSTISAFKAISGERKERNKKVYTELESVARIQSVKSSNAIEGIVNAESSGKYKNEDNLIMAVDAFGKRSVRFRPVPANETKEAMEQLVLACMDARTNPNINQLLLVPCVVLDFLCIHPFNDGNGSVSRLLSLLLMYKNGYDVGKYVSFEEQINDAKELYYDALYESSKDWHDNQNSYIPFMENFLVTLYRCYKELDKRFSTINGKRLKKNERIEQTVLNSIIPISKTEICEILPDISVSTVETVLGKLMRSGKIKKLGQARTTKYVNADYVK